jgi:hypothetical protein
MKKMNIFKCALAFVVIGLTSCLDLTVQSTRPNYSDPSEALMRGLLTTGYNMMMSGNMYGEYSWGQVGGCDTDESFLKNASSSDATTLGIHNITATSTNVKNFYQQFYRGIECCNLVIDMSKNVTMDSIAKNDLIGQAKTLRAFYLYQLAVNFGPVPIKTVPTHLMVGFELSRDSVKKVCQFALNEMRSAIPLLKPIAQVGFTSTITQSAAEALSYRVALYMASHPDIRDIAKYDSIAVWGKNFINSGVHSLNSVGYIPATTNNSTWNETTSAYARLFVRNMENKSVWGGSDKEGILDAVFYVKSLTSGTYANMGYATTQEQKLGVSTGVECPVQTINNNPIGYCAPTYSPLPTLFNKFEKGDLRRYWNVSTYCYKDNTATRYPYYFIDFAGATTSSAGTTVASMGAPTRKAVLIPSIINGALNTDPTTMIIDDGGAGYTDGTYWVPIDGYKSSGSTIMTPTAALANTVVGIAHNATDVTRAAATYPSGTQRVQVQVVGGTITSILAIATQGTSSAKTGYVNVNVRGIGKWRREYEINLPAERNKDYTSSNFPVIRYADVLLMVAEAAIYNTGSKGGAMLADGKEYLNMVRRRGFGLVPTNPSTTVDKELTLDIVKDERARELCYEGVRRVDLIRWGEAYYRTVATQVDADLDKYSAGLVNGKYAIDLLMGNFTKYQVLPIPTTEISATPNTFYQNSGW